MNYCGQGILKGEHCAVDLLFDWFGISCMKTDNFVFIYKTDLSKPVKQEVHSTELLPPLVFPTVGDPACSASMVTRIIDLQNG